MKSRSLLFIIASLLAAVLVASGCGGGKTTTSNPPTTTTNPPTSTTNPPTTTTNPPTTTTTTPTITPPPSSSTQTGVLSETAPPITTHSAVVLTAYKGLCLTMCHGPGLSNSSPFPPTWDGKAAGSTLNPGVYTVKPGSNADHTGRTEDLCTTQAGCHTAPK